MNETGQGRRAFTFTYCLHGYLIAPRGTALVRFIPIQQDAGGGVELELVALFEGAPTVIIGFGVEGDLFLGGFREVVEEDKVEGGRNSWGDSR